MISMSLTSLTFFAFFIISLIIYYLIPKRCQWMALLGFSVVFFLLSATPYTGIYILVSIVCTTVSARKISQGLADGDQAKARRALIFGLIINVGLLAALKYTNFFILNINKFTSMLHIFKHIREVAWPAPMGISFYTLQVVGYLLNVYWGTVPAQQSMLKTALFTGYYPQLTSGPISRYHQLKDTLFAPHDFSERNISYGLQRMMWGVFKKIVISDRLAIVVNTIYGDTATYNGFYIWIAAAFFMLQLYTDFSGCMDIIIGASECYGITLPENFRTPFFSRSVQEFWQRWHITLGSWLKDFILYPILYSDTWRNLAKWTKGKWGKKASKQIPTYLGLLCAWMVMGLWHGGKWKYVFGQGLWFWGCIVLSQILEPFFKKATDSLKINTECFSWHLFQSLQVFVLVCIGNMFFRLDGFKETLKTMRAGFANWNPEVFFDGSLFKLGLKTADFNVMIMGLLVLLFISALQENGSVRERLSGQNMAFRWFMWLCLIFAVILFGMYGPGYDAQAFIYERF